MFPFPLSVITYSRNLLVRSPRRPVSYARLRSKLWHYVLAALYVATNPVLSASLKTCVFTSWPHTLSCCTTTKQYLPNPYLHHQKAIPAFSKTCCTTTKQCLLNPYLQTDFSAIGQSVRGDSRGVVGQLHQLRHEGSIDGQSIFSGVPGSIYGSFNRERKR